MIGFTVTLVLSSYSYLTGDPFLGNWVVVAGFVSCLVSMILFTVRLITTRRAVTALSSSPNVISEPLPFRFRALRPSRGTLLAISVLPIFLAGFAVFRWFSGPNIILDADFNWWSNMPRQLWQSYFLWDSTSSPIGLPKRIVGADVTLLAGTAFQSIGLGNVVSYQLWFYLAFVGAGLSMFLFTHYVAPTQKRLSATLASLIYLFNPYTLLSPIIFVQYVWFTFFPLKMFLFFKGVVERRRFYYALGLAFVVSLTSTPNPGLIFLDFSAFLGYLLFYSITSDRARAAKSLAFTTKFLFAYVILNAYFILPMLVQAQNLVQIAIEVFSQQGETTMSLWRANSATSFSADIRLQGYFGTTSGYQGIPYYPWAPLLNTPVFIAIGYLLPFAFALGVLKTFKNRNCMFLANLTVIGIILVDGASQPFGFMNSAIYNLNPFIPALFHLPYHQFGRYVLLGYASLGGLGLASLYRRAREMEWSRNNLSFRHPRFIRRPVALGLFLCLAVLIVGVYPQAQWTGAVVRPSNPYLGTTRYSLPSYYQNISNFLSGSNGYVLSLPNPRVGNAAYNWSGNIYAGPDVTSEFLQKIVAPQGWPINNIIDHAFDGHSVSDPAKLLSLLNVRYVAVQNDFYPGWLSAEKTGSYYVPGQVSHFGSGFLRMENGTSFETPSNQLSISLWISPSGGGLQHVVSKWYSANVEGSFLIFLDSNRIGFAVQTSNGAAEIKSSEITPNNWHHVVGTYDGNQITLYVNEKIEATSFISGTIAANSLPLTIGERSNSGGYLFNGALTNVQIYGISTNETMVNTLFSRGIFGSPLENHDLVSWWKLSNMGPGPVPDLSGNHYDLTASGTVDSTSYLLYPMPQGLSGPKLGEILASIPGFVEIRRFGQVDLFENSRWKDITVYAASNLVRGGNLTDVARLVDNITETSRYVFYVSSGDSIPIVSNNTEDMAINYAKDNPTEYTVKLRSTHPFYLVLSQDFDNAWIGSIGGTPLPASFHFMANGFANGWYVPYQGDLTLRLQYGPQTLVYLGTGLALIFVTAVVLHRIARKRIKDFPGRMAMPRSGSIPNATIDHRLTHGSKPIDQP